MSHRMALLRQAMASAERGLPSTSPSAAYILKNSSAARHFRTGSVKLQQEAQKKAAVQPTQPPKPLSPEDVAKVVQTAQTKVFGTAFPGNLRTGRKRLRAILRGPASKNWYGYTFDDILPEALTEMKEDYYRDEEQLNRLGKTRITGKMKNPLKSKVEVMQFDDMIEGVADSLDEVNPEEFLTDMELAAREMELAEAESEADIAVINSYYTRLVAHRERNIDAVLAEAEKGHDAQAEAEGAKAKKKASGNFTVRQGLNDKRVWGAESKSGKKPGDEDLGKGSPARDTAAPGAAAGAPAAEGSAEAAAAPAGGASPRSAAGSVEEALEFTSLSTDLDGWMADSDPLVRGLATAIAPGSWSVDATLVREVLTGNATPEIKKQVEDSYAAHVAVQAGALWNALEAIKGDPSYGMVWLEYEHQLQEAGGHPMSKEGLQAFLLANEEAKATAMATALGGNADEEA